MLEVQEKREKLQMLMLRSISLKNSSISSTRDLKLISRKLPTISSELSNPL